MDSIDRLKLAIYESGLSGEDQEALLEYVEEAVIDKDDVKTLANVVPKYLTAVGGVSTIANSGKFNSINKKIKENKTRLKVLCDKLKKEDDPRKQEQLEHQIDVVQSDITRLEVDLEVAKKALGRSAAMFGVGAAGTGISTALKKREAKRIMNNLRNDAE